MKQILLRFIFLLIVNVGFSQQIAIPYRDGEKWGICNAEAKLLIEPKFDEVEFYTNFSEDYQVLISKVKNLKGLIIEGKEILEPIYESISKSGDLYVAVKIENGQKRTKVISSDGKTILPKPIVEIIVNENFGDKLHLFQVLNLDFSESVFIYDSTLNTISQWLYEDYYSLDLLRIKNITQVNFKVKRKENDPLFLETWDFSKLPKEVIKSKLYYKSEADLMALFTRKTNERSSDKYGSGAANGDFEIRGDNGEAIVIDEPVSSNGESKIARKQPVYMSNKFKIENDKLVLITRNEQTQNSPEKILPVNLKIPISDIEIKFLTTLVKKNDTIQYYNNIVFYKKKDKKGILFSADTKNLMEFDTIVKQGFAIGSDYNNQLVFLVGNKQAKTKNFKYSFYCSNQKLLFPVQFDNLKSSILTQENQIRTYIAKIGSTYGIVQNDGREILKCEYDEIKEFESSVSGAKIVQVKKDNKYRFITQKYGGNLNQNPASFDYPIKDVILNYPKRYYDNSGGINQTINLLELVDENKKRVGYASDNGTLYFKK